MYFAALFSDRIAALGLLHDRQITNLVRLREYDLAKATHYTYFDRDDRLPPNIIAEIKRMREEAKLGDHYLIRTDNKVGGSQLENLYKVIEASLNRGYTPRGSAKEVPRRDALLSAVLYRVTDTESPEIVKDLVNS